MGSAFDSVGNYLLLKGKFVKKKKIQRKLEMTFYYQHHRINIILMEVDLLKMKLLSFFYKKV